MKKLVNIKMANPTVALKTIIRGNRYKQTLDVNEIRQLLIKKAIVEEVLSDGTTVPLDFTNYNKEHLTKAEQDKKEAEEKAAAEAKAKAEAEAKKKAEEEAAKAKAEAEAKAKKEAEQAAAKQKAIEQAQKEEAARVAKAAATKAEMDKNKAKQQESKK